MEAGEGFSNWGGGGGAAEGDSRGGRRGKESCRNASWGVLRARFSDGAGVRMYPHVVLRGEEERGCCMKVAEGNWGESAALLSEDPSDRKQNCMAAHAALRAHE